jgi:hypothetical protein
LVAGSGYRFGVCIAYRDKEKVVGVFVRFSLHNFQLYAVTTGGRPS